ncbi:MAG: HAMP domain-containing sensor histidine kinase [Candidatus Delongbacteria bacterium]|nr:HAMP domain-containing sensor histidine kinase [Candidatus Delongbacteria bacterium]
MKRNKLAFKLILAFVILLAINNISSFLIMRYVKFEQRKEDHEFYTSISNFAFKDLVERRLDIYSISEVKNNKHYQNFLSDISDSHNLNVVITDNDDKILLKPVNFHDTESVEQMILESKASENHPLKPFPIKIPFKTKNNEEGLVYLFHEYDTSFADTHANILFSSLLILNIILLLFISKKLTDPVRRFDLAIKSISNGDFSTRIKLKRKDEFGRLADTFNSMAAKIEEVIAEQKESSANISHELRSPLTRIRVAVQILKDINTEKCTEGEPYFESIDKEIEGMDIMIDGILKYYRIDNDSSQSVENIDIIDLLENELSKQASYFDILNINSVNNIQVDTFSAKILPSIRSVFENIISNASKYTIKNGTFTVSAAKDNNDLMITFENTIEQNSDIDLEKIYQPFYRGNNIDAVKGTGMGLAIAKKIADLNNCDLSIVIDENIFKVVLVVKG